LKDSGSNEEKSGEPLGKAMNRELAAISGKYEEFAGRLQVEKVRCRPNETTKIMNQNFYWKYGYPY